MIGACFASCGEKKQDDLDIKDNEKVTYNTDCSIHDMVDAVTEKLSYEGKVGEFLYKESDPDEMVKWIYGVVDINASQHLTDYAITTATDFNNTLAIFVFDDEMTEADYDEVKSAVTTTYIETRRSALQMYMPEQYEHVKWQLENPDAIWRQYSNVLVLCAYDSQEPTAAWDALEALFTK